MNKPTLEERCAPNGLISESKIYKLLFVFCLLWFIFLCFFHYCSGRPLWLDENFLLQNIKSLQYKEIFGPLKNAQAFPRLYLVSIKFFAERFHYHVLALRFFPLVAMLFAFFIWAKIYKKGFLCKWSYLLSLFSFATSYSLSYYAAEFKHYSMDLLVVALFTLYLIYQKEYFDKKPSRAFIVGTLILPFSLFLSYSSFFVFWIVSYNFLFTRDKNIKFWFILVSYTFLSALAIAFVFYFDIKYTLSNAALFSYWNDYFLCTDSFYCFMKSFGEGLSRLSVWWFGNSVLFRRIASFFIPFFIFCLFGYGIKSIRNKAFRLTEIDSLGFVIFCELFFVGILKKYPFTGERITLFFAPFVFYFIVKSINFFKFNKLLYIFTNSLYVIFLILCGFNSFRVYFKHYG